MIAKNYIVSNIEILYISIYTYKLRILIKYCNWTAIHGVVKAIASLIYFHEQSRYLDTEARKRAADSSWLR